MGMQSLADGWKSYLLFILLSFTGATSTIAYNNINTRIGILESDKRDSVKIVTDTAVQLAVLQANVKDIQVSLNKMEGNQDKLLNKVDNLLLGVSKDSRRWNAAMDALERANREKK